MTSELRALPHPSAELREREARPLEGLDVTEIPAQAALDALHAIEVGLTVLIGLAGLGVALLALILWRVW